MLTLTEVKLYSPNSFQFLQMTPWILLTVHLAAEKKRSALCCYMYLWCYWLILIVQLIEHGQVVIPTGSVIKGSIPFYWVLLK